jgi:ACDE family multidrug resistance protein
VSEGKLFQDRNLQIVFGVTLMAVLSVSSITPAFPSIMEEFNITPGRVGLLITFFTLPGVFLSPVLGVLADRLGRKRILVPSLFLFAIAGAACAFTRDFNLLLVLRIFQGIGGASLGSINTTLIGDLYSGPRRAEAMGLNASILSIGTASYPAIGGALAVFGWNYPFLLPLLALPIGIAVLFFLHNPEPKNHQDLGEYISGTWRHLKNIKILGFFLAGIITFLLLYGTLLTYFPLLLAERFDASPFIIGLLISAMSLTTATVSSQLGRIYKLAPLGTIIAGSFALYGVAYILIPQMPVLWLILIPVALFGIAHGGNVPGLQTGVAGLAPLEHRAAFMSLNATVLRLGQTIGPPVMTLIYLQQGYAVIFYVSGAIAFVTALTPFLYSILKRREQKN